MTQSAQKQRDARAALTVDFQYSAMFRDIEDDAGARKIEMHAAGARQNAGGEHAGLNAEKAPRPFLPRHLGTHPSILVLWTLLHSTLRTIPTLSSQSPPQYTTLL